MANSLTNVALTVKTQCTDHTDDKLLSIFDLIYPVGSLYFNCNNVNPAVLFGGAWERIEDKFLLCSGNTFANQSTGGKISYTLTADNIPTHTHSISSNGDHTHTRGTMEITGTFSSPKQLNANFNLSTATGAFSSLGQHGASNSIRNTADNATNQALVGFTASKSWTGATSSNGAHTHTVGSTGSGSAFDIIPPYLAVNVWKRVA